MANKYTFIGEFYRWAESPEMREIGREWGKQRAWHEPHHVQRRIARAMLRNYPDAEDAIFLYGFTELMTWLLKPVRKECEPRPLPEQQRSRAAYEVRKAKVEAFDRIVEMLDHMQVDGKILGDCTRADLLRAAVRAETTAGEMTMNAALYRELATLVGNGTVREASQRGKIVALLTSRFEEV